MLTFFFFIMLKNNLTCPLPNLKDKVLNKVINPTGAPIADANDADNVPLVTERTNKHI